MRSEIKLMYSALVLFFANLLYAAYFVFRDQMIAQYKEFGKYSEWTLFLLADIYDLHNSYALVLTSKEVRKAVWRTIKFSNEDSIVPITGFSVNQKQQQKGASTNLNNTIKTETSVGPINNIV
uniref:Uncharacterized protein n=1 Tax=Panagrolaimus sp. ES5 TaxID=591445 RepID=A0AC34G7U4_9BILA